MNSIDTEKLHSCWWDSHISPKNTKWLAENLEEVDQSVKAMLKLIEEDGDSFAKKDGMNNERRPELIAHAEGFYRNYKSLAERYDQLIGELRKSVPSLLQIQNSVISQSGSGQDSLLVTPDQRSGHKKFEQKAIGFDLFLSSSGSSDPSLKEGSESSSLASDSESESFDSSINKHSNLHVTVDGKGLYQKVMAQKNELSGVKEITEKENADNELEVHGNEGYAALLKRISKYEQELKECNKKLQLSEEEVARLKGEFKKSEAVQLLICNLQTQLESAQRAIKVREADIEMEKTRVLELQKEVFEGTNHWQGQLELAQKDIATLEAKLDLEKRQVLELQESNVMLMADVSERDQDIKELNVALSNAQKTFSLDKAKLQSDISVLSNKLALSKARFEESEMQSKSLENEIRQCEAEKKEMKCLHEAQQIDLWSEIELLSADVAEKGALMEALNKKLDTLKLKYDMLVAEKDEVNAKVQTLIADMFSRDNQIQQMEELLRQMHIECVEHVVGLESARELVDELKLKVGELEKDVAVQKLVISDRAEEKREAIRQLCFSLEHYRNGYQELRQAFVGLKRHAVLAS